MTKFFELEQNTLWSISLINKQLFIQTILSVLYELTLLIIYKKYKSKIEKSKKDE